MKKLIFFFCFSFLLTNLYSSLVVSNDLDSLIFDGTSNTYLYFDVDSEVSLKRNNENNYFDNFSDFYKYDEIAGLSWLKSDYCELNFNSGVLNANWNLEEGTNKKIVDFLKNNNVISGGKEYSGNDILNNNLWMNVEISYEGLKLNILVDDDGITKEEILKKVKKEYEENFKSSLGGFLNLYVGKTVSFTVKLNEPKCSNNGDEFENLIKLNLLKVKTKKVDKIEITKDKNELDKNKIGLTEDGNLKFKGKILNLETLTNDDFSLNDIALISHNFKKFKTKISAEIFLNQTIKNLNLFDGSLAKGKTLWVYFDKTKYSTFDDLKTYLNIKDYKNFIIKDLDPIIGFDGIDDDDFDRGDFESEIILIEETPILYNSKYLVFNYRKSACDNSNEKYLFTISNILGGVITDNSNSTTSGDKFNVCVSHSDNLDFEINSSFDFTNLNNFKNGAEIFKDYENLNYDLKIQTENPENGFYSCLGSINTENKFGDCDTFSNKIWVYLGTKSLENNFKVGIKKPFNSFVSDNINFDLELFEYNNQDFNLEFKFGNDVYNLDKTNFTNGISNNLFYSKCDNLPKSCNIKYSINLTQDGTEIYEFSESLFIPTKGSTCQADCTLLPVPSLYVKSCYNLNSCKFYNQTIADKCDFKPKGTYVSFDEDEEILCPNGPKRFKSKTSKSIEINSHYKEVVTKRISVKYNNEFVEMVIAMPVLS